MGIVMGRTILQMDEPEHRRYRGLLQKVFTEKASGAQRERPRLQEALAYMRKGDTLVVWKLDRMARSLKQLIETVL